MNQTYTAAEEWRPLPGHETQYEISNLGRVRSVKRTVTIVREYGGKLVKPLRKKNGYLVFNLAGPGMRKQIAMQRAVLLAFVGPPKHGQQACHNNGVRADNRLENLRWDSVKANHADMVLHGTRQKGSGKPNAKLTEEKVQGILSSTDRLIDIADAHGVALSTVGHIRTRRKWTHVK